MAKKKKSPLKKKVKVKSVRFYGLNITIQTQERKPLTLYSELIKKIHEEQMHFFVGHEITMVFRTQFSTNFKFNEIDYPVFYGKVLRFNTIKNWYNQREQIFQDYKLPENLVPNAFETDYVFIPEAHKLFIRYNNRINIYQVKTFIEKALKDFVITDEKFHVNIISSSDKIDSILSAKVISSLSVDISYTNDDIGSEAQELIDKMLKEAQSGETTVTLKPDANGTLNPQSDLVKGFVGVAKDNGTVTARIVNTNGKAQTIKTESYPEKINLQIIEKDGVKEDEKKVLFNRIMTEYRQPEKEQINKKKNVNKRRRK